MKNQENMPKENNENAPGYPSHPSDQDIYKQDQEEQNIDPTNAAETKTPAPDPEEPNEVNYDEGSAMGGDLDVPGEELDDEDEKIGEEDEENNYYSLGGEKDE